MLGGRFGMRESLGLCLLVAVLGILILNRFAFHKTRREIILEWGIEKKKKLENQR